MWIHVLHHTHKLSLDQFSMAFSNTTALRELPQLELNPGSSSHSASVKCVPVLFFPPTIIPRFNNYFIHHGSMKQKIQFPSVMRFNVSVPIWHTVVDVLLKSRHTQTLRLHHMTKACVCVCVFALSGSVGGFYNGWRGTIVLSVSSYCVRCISRAGHTVFHVSLIRLSLAGLAASTGLRRAAQQGHHSPPTNPTLLPLSPADSLLAWLPVTQLKCFQSLRKA